MGGRGDKKSNPYVGLLHLRTLFGNFGYQKLLVYSSISLTVVKYNLVPHTDSLPVNGSVAQILASLFSDKCGRIFC